MEKTMHQDDMPQPPRIIRLTDMPQPPRIIRLTRDQMIKFVGELHERHMDKLEEALAASDMQESKDVIKYIMEKN